MEDVVHEEDAAPQISHQPRQNKPQIYSMTSDIPSFTPSSYIPNISFKDVWARHVIDCCGASPLFGFCVSGPIFSGWRMCQNERNVVTYSVKEISEFEEDCDRRMFPQLCLSCGDRCDRERKRTLASRRSGVL
jgi:hypothetical protein